MDTVPPCSVWLPNQPIDLSSQQSEAGIVGCWMVPPPQVCVLPLPVAFEPEPWLTKPVVPDLGDTSADPLGFGDIDPAATDPLTGVGEASLVEPPLADVSLQEPAPAIDVLDEPSTADPGFDAAGENQVEWTAEGINLLIEPFYSMTISVYYESYVQTAWVMPTPFESDDSNSLSASYSCCFTSVEGAPTEYYLSGESALEAPLIVGCEPYPYFIGEPFLVPEITSVPESGESLEGSNSSAIEPLEMSTEAGQNLIDPAENDLSGTPSEFSVSGEIVPVDLPWIYSCGFFPGKPFLLPEFTSSPESEEPLVFPCLSATEPFAEFVEDVEDLTDQAENELFEVDSLVVEPDASVSIMPNGPIRLVKPYYRTHVDPMVFALSSVTGVTAEGSVDELEKPLPSLTPAGDDAEVGGDRSGWALSQPSEESVLEPVSPSGFDAPDQPPAPLDLDILGSVVAPDPRPLRGAPADLFSAYIAFLQSNPQWLDDHGATGIQMQVMTPSSYLPSLDLPTPGDARAFDAWYEQTQLPNDVVCRFDDLDQPPPPLFCPPPNCPPPNVISTPKDLPAACEIPIPISAPSEQPIPLPTTVLASSQAPPESVSAQELVPSTSGHSTAALILSIPEEPGAASFPSAAASPFADVSPLSTSATVAVTIPLSNVGESDLLLARRRREEPTEMSLLPIG